MRRPSAIMALAALLAGLHTLLRPVSLTQAMQISLLAVLYSLPGLLLTQFAHKSRRAVWANLLGFGDALCTGLPLAMLLNSATAGAGLFCAVHALAYQLIGGWLLRRSGIGTDKNFLLILAYRQTLAHCRHFPEEVHPSENPLFQPARSAQRALAELLPLAVVGLAMLPRAAGVVPGKAANVVLSWKMYAVSAILLLHTTAHLGRIVWPLHRPDARCISAILARIFGAVLVLAVLGNHRGFARLTILAAMPPVPTLIDELQRGGANDAAIRFTTDVAQWSWLSFPLLLLMAAM